MQPIATLAEQVGGVQVLLIRHTEASGVSIHDLLARSIALLIRANYRLADVRLARVASLQAVLATDVVLSRDDDPRRSARAAALAGIALLERVEEPVVATLVHRLRLDVMPR